MQQLRQSAGFRCELCGLVFTNNVNLVDHMHSPSHRARASAPPVTRASFEDVQKRIKQLAAERGLLKE